MTHHPTLSTVAPSTVAPSTVAPSTGVFSQTAEAAGARAALSPIVVRNLSVRYGGKTALADLSMEIQPGYITALIGPSGCGKTSYLNCLNRMTDLVPGCTVSGSVEFGGLELLDPGLDVVSLRRSVGMIFQKPNPFPMSVRRNLEMPLREHGIRDRGRLDELVETTLRDVGLWNEVSDRLDGSALSLSGGQQQRLCIARAIALQPQVLLLDEPCSALDPIASGVVEDLILSLRNRFSLVVVTHNLAQARRIADDVAVLWLRAGAGRLIESGSARDVFSAPRDPDAAAYICGQRG